MTKRLLLLVALILISVSATAPLALAAEEGKGATESELKYFAVAAFACAFGIGIAAFGGALAQGRSVDAAVEGIARNPGAAAPIRLNLIIGLAFIESLVIYTLVVVLILLFVNPFGI